MTTKVKESLIVNWFVEIGLRTVTRKEARLQLYVFTDETRLFVIAYIICLFFICMFNTDDQGIRFDHRSEKKKPLFTITV